MLRSALLLAAASLLLPTPAAFAKEESKIQIRLLSPSNGNGNGNAIGNAIGNGNGNGNGGSGMRGDVRTHLQGSKVVLQLRVRGLEPDSEYALLCLESETATEAAELLRFSTGANGSANLTQNLAKTEDPEAPADPRGKLLSLVDAGDQEVLRGWLYGAPEDDGPQTKVKERTQLADDEASDPSGRVDATYQRLPNGQGKLAVDARGIPAGDYRLLVDGVEVAVFSPNPGGNAKLDFRTKPGKGKGPKKVKPHQKKQQLDFDPRRKLVEVQLEDGTPMFAGPMLAQVDGLNVCSESAVESALTGAGAETGTVRREVESDCETALEVAVSDVTAGSYDLYVDGNLVVSFDAADDGGTVVGGARFDPTPDSAEEFALDFAIAAGLPVEIFAMGADPQVDAPLLTGTLP